MRRQQRLVILAAVFVSVLGFVLLMVVLHIVSLFN